MIPPVDRTIALVGLMGVGKSTVGRRLAARLGLPFIDGDDEIETAAAMSVSLFDFTVPEIDDLVTCENPIAEENKIMRRKIFFIFVLLINLVQN